MKKVFLAISIVSAVLFITSCGGEKKSSVKVSTEMQDFMNNLNGKSASVTAALQQFGYSDLDNKDMDMYDLKEPKVLEASKNEYGNCYLLQCKSGMTKRKYNLCWKAGKIYFIEDKGME